MMPTKPVNTLLVLALVLLSIGMIVWVGTLANGPGPTCPDGMLYSHHIGFCTPGVEATHGN
jgi:hypothetical protein